MAKRETSYDTEVNKVVVRNDFVQAIHPDRMDLNTMKLFRLVISQCRKNDKELFSYDFKITDLAKIIGINSSNIYRDAEDMCTSMMQMILKYGGGNPKQSWKLKHIFGSCEYDARIGTVTIKLHEDMSDLLLRLGRNFTRIPISDVLMMKSKYAIRIYELILEKMQSNIPHAAIAVGIHLTLDEIRNATGTSGVKSYTQVGHLKKKILIPSIQAIEEATKKKEHKEFTGWKILCSDVKRGRQIVGFDLEIWERNGYEVVENCKRTGKPLPGRYSDDMPGQMNIEDFAEWA